MTLNTFVAGNSGLVRQLADSMRNLGAGVEDTARGLHRARSESESEWQGEAADAFRTAADRDAGDADRLAQLHTDLATALTGFADDLDTVNARMVQARQVAAAGKLRVQAMLIFPPDPAPTSPSGGNPPLPLGQPAADPASAAASRAQQRQAYAEAEQTVNQARDLERSAHQRLKDALNTNTVGLDQLGQRDAWMQAASHPSTPAAVALANAADGMETWATDATMAAFERAIQGGPAGVHGMWISLTRAQQDDLTARDPMLVGNTDGVPAATRDSVNRSVLTAEAAGNPRMQTLLQSLDRGGVRRLLLGFEPRTDAGRGRAIVANGDPDTADNVVTNVPGTETDLDSVGDDPTQDEIHKIDNIANQAQSLDPNRHTAVIAWVNYDTPQFESMTNSPAWEGDANRAKNSLAQFQQGLQVTHYRPNQPNYTVVGHSYGSTVVGYAARDGHLPNTNLVFLGSPGVGVDNASQLHEDPNRVWAGHSHGDNVANVTKVYRFGNWGQPDGSVPPDMQFFGRDPASPDFGDRILPVDNTGGHSQYYDLHPDIDGIARIAVRQQPGS